MMNREVNTIKVLISITHQPVRSQTPQLGALGKDDDREDYRIKQAIISHGLSI